MAARSWDMAQPRLIPRNSFPPIVKCAEAAGQTFKAGAPVYLVSNLVTICADDTVGFLGIAMADATGTTSADCYVQVAHPDGCYVIAGVSANGTAALASTLTFGEAYGVNVDSNSVMTVDSASTNDVFIFEEPIYDANGDSTYWGRFIVKAGVAGGFDEENA